MASTMYRCVRRALPVALLALLLTSSPAAFGQEQQKVAFDLKTKFSEKLDLTPVKNGALLILMESDWANTREFGEDYALWLRNPVRETVGDSITLTFDVELRTPSLFEEGDLLSTRKIAVTYHPSDDWKAHGTESVVDMIQTVETCVNAGALVAGAFYPTATAIAMRVLEGVEEIMPADLPVMKLEAMLAGAKVVGAARQMVRF